jgi:hypothetical protein
VRDRQRAKGKDTAIGLSSVKAKVPGEIAKASRRECFHNAFTGILRRGEATCSSCLLGLAAVLIRTFPENGVVVLEEDERGSQSRRHLCHQGYHLTKVSAQLPSLVSGTRYLGFPMMGQGPNTSCSLANSVVRIVMGARI